MPHISWGHIGFFACPLSRHTAMAHVDPTKERIGAFKDLPQDEPIHMLNLIGRKRQRRSPGGGLRCRTLIPST